MSLISNSVRACGISDIRLVNSMCWYSCVIMTVFIVNVSLNFYKYVSKNSKWLNDYNFYFVIKYLVFNFKIKIKINFRILSTTSNLNKMPNHVSIILVQRFCLYKNIAHRKPSLRLHMQRRNAGKYNTSLKLQSYFILCIESIAFCVIFICSAQFIMYFNC